MRGETRITPDSPEKSGAGWEEREAALVRLAQRQHGAVAAAQLHALGFPHATIHDRRRLGRLCRIQQGVYALGRPDLPAKGRWMAAVLACGPGAVLSHAAAAALHGIRATAAALIDITLTQPRSIKRPGIRVHTCTRLTAADISEEDGIPVTSVARTLLDLASFLTQPQLERACEQAVLEGLFDLNEISDLLARSHGCPGVRNLRTVLARGDLGVNVPVSGLERRFRDLCRQAGLPAPEINRYVLLGDEYHKVDFLWRRERVVIEVDGGRYHSMGWQRRRDAKRDALLLAHGYASARIADTEIAERPAQAVQAARTLLAGR
jgi:very-short-patch-repair endonuclease